MWIMEGRGLSGSAAPRVGDVSTTVPVESFVELLPVGDGLDAGSFEELGGRPSEGLADGLGDGLSDGLGDGLFEGLGDGLEVGLDPPEVSPVTLALLSRLLKSLVLKVIANPNRPVHRLSGFSSPKFAGIVLPLRKPTGKSANCPK